ncbi:MAG: hypothetical protein FWG83_06320 [Oscillospiraceae bacterium]|nr:hypothetical protein [Oscillospiraceae bacterium]
MKNQINNEKLFEAIGLLSDDIVSEARDDSVGVYSLTPKIPTEFSPQSEQRAAGRKKMTFLPAMALCLTVVIGATALTLGGFFNGGLSDKEPPVPPYVPEEPEENVRIFYARDDGAILFESLHLPERFQNHENLTQEEMERDARGLNVDEDNKDLYNSYKEDDITKIFNIWAELNGLEDISAINVQRYTNYITTIRVDVPKNFVNKITFDDGGIRREAILLSLQYTISQDAFTACDFLTLYAGGDYFTSIETPQESLTVFIGAQNYLSDDTPELIFEDKSYRYYLSSIRSHLIMVTFDNTVYNLGPYFGEAPYVFSLKYVLEQELSSIDTLFSYGLRVSIEKKSDSSQVFTEPPSFTPLIWLSDELEPKSYEIIQQNNDNNVQFHFEDRLTLAEFPDVVFEFMQGTQIKAIYPNGDEKIIATKSLSGLIGSVHIADVTGDGFPDFVFYSSWTSGVFTLGINVFDFANDTHYSLQGYGSGISFELIDSKFMCTVDCSYHQKSSDKQKGILHFMNDRLILLGVKPEIECFNANCGPRIG